MLKNLLLPLVLLCTLGPARSQSKFFEIPLAASAHASSINQDWNIHLQPIEGQVADEHRFRDAVNEVKQKLISKYAPGGAPPEQELRDEMDSPFVWNGILANTYNFSVPNDNELAVSTTGFLVSVMNSTIYTHDLNADTAITYLSLSAFADVLGNLQSKYDPKVIYDPDENRFVVVFLAGFLDSTSNIIVAFSETDHPGGTWNFYELPGNPLNDTLWSDYPMVALTNQELFITVNHLQNNVGWINGWQRSVIWQINKADGYHGNALSSLLHYEVAHEGKLIRNLCPVKGGSHLYGSDIYFLSQKNLAETSDTFYLVHLTDTINAPSLKVESALLKSDVAYHMPVNADQPENKGDLLTNDSRVLGAFYENDRIQFVGNTTDTVTLTSAIYHGVIKEVSVNPQITLRMVSDDSTYYGYPNLSYVGNDVMDHRAVISFLHAGADINPGFSVLVADGDGGYSAVRTVKEGESYHALLSGDERWGDYSGSQRDYSTAGRVWVNGSYATLSHKVNTWCALISLDPPPAGTPEEPDAFRQFSLYPNPAGDVLSLELIVPAYTVCAFDVYDMNGRLVKRLMNENVRPGKSVFTFSPVHLTAGEYILRVTSNEQIIASERFVKQ